MEVRRTSVWNYAYIEIGKNDGKKEKTSEQFRTLTDRYKMTGYIYYPQKLPGILLTNLNCGNLRFFRLQYKNIRKVANAS